ncbi:MarR family winged helix-turn-helix transcriptional regulator [Streptomyces tendae]|uniref:MarR family winged helix-turn-helix transcriptional regulator n=2 Tax=Streptomyces tendae TaxID=1932 RepID=UPI00343824A0
MPRSAVEPIQDRGDSVDAMLRQWAEHRPGVDVSSSEVVARLLRAARLAEELFEARLRRQPGRTITNVGDFDLLQTLRRAAPGHALTPGQLMRHLVVSSAGLSGRLNRLERDGWIVRTASPDDRRRSLVKLTVQGREEFDRRLEDHLAVERKLLSVLDARERAVVVDALRKLLFLLEAPE